MAGVFRPRKGAGFTTGPGKFYLDWRSDQVLATVVEAARRGINDVSELGANIARTEHLWDNRTGQTEASVFTKGAVIEGAPLRVWGEWGVHDRPHLDDEGEVRLTQDPNTGLDRPVTTKDVALWLEFGTVEMVARPWLYPAWDQTKILLPAAIKSHYEEISISGAPTAIRDIGGRFLPHSFLD